jgi:ABC-2 type transport system permease protein
MTRSVAAELLAIRKRPSTWILLGIWSALAVFFSYGLPYLTYLNDSGGPLEEPLADLLPRRLPANVSGGFPF